jgi:hypothetical protein
MQGDSRRQPYQGHTQSKPGQPQGGEYQQSRPTNQPARPGQQQQQQQQGLGQGQAQQQQRKPTPAHKPSSDATHDILNQVLASGDAAGKHAFHASGKQQQQQAHPQQQAGRQQGQQQQQQQRQHGKQREKQVAGKKRKHADVAVPDEDGIAGADSDEEGHVGEALALMLGREQTLQQEATRTAQRTGGDNSDSDEDFFAQVGACLCPVAGMVQLWLMPLACHMQAQARCWQQEYACSGCRLALVYSSI